MRPYRSRIALLETDALRWRQPVRPYRSRIALLETDALRWTLPVHPDIRRFNHQMQLNWFHRASDKKAVQELGS